jgi:hypothetical protein
MAGNFMSKPIGAKPVVPKKTGGIKKPILKGKPKVHHTEAKPIEEAPTFKEVTEELAQNLEESFERMKEQVAQQTSEPMVGQCPPPGVKESLEKEVKIEVEEVEVPVADPEDDDKFEDKAMEEMEKEVNEEVEEEKPKTKKRTRKKAKKESSDTTIVIDSEPLSVEEYKDYMAEIIRPSIQEWEDEKEEVKDKMSTLNLDPNMNPKEIRELLAGLTDMHKEMQDRLDEAKVNLDNTVELIKSVEIKATAEGANAEERKLKALIAKENYVKEGETHSVNLTVFKQLLNERVLFYNSQINTLEYNKFLVMTFQKVCSTENKGF